MRTMESHDIILFIYFLKNKRCEHVFSLWLKLNVTLQELKQALFLLWDPKVAL